MSHRIVVLPGDGIGPEVVAEAVRVLERTAAAFDFSVDLEYALIGGAAYEVVQKPLPEETLQLCAGADAILLGAIGGPQWDDLPSTSRPEAALLGLRSHLGLYANLRPARVFAALVEASPLKRSYVEGVDLLIVRELTGGIYYGTPRGIADDGRRRVGINTEIYRSDEIERIGRVAFEHARTRRSKVTSVDKANVLETSQLWREIVRDLARDYPEVTLENLYVDNCAMQLVTNPKRFDVVLTSNLFGDILSDEAAVITGSIGMLPSASMGSGVALYEPVHGSAPELAGKNVANPLAAILSLAMMVQHSLKLPLAARCIEAAVRQVLDEGFRTADLVAPGQNAVSTSRMGTLVAGRI